MGTIEVRLTFALSLRVATGSPPYTSMTAQQKCDAKTELLAPFTSPAMQSLLASWAALSMPGDPDCCEVPDAALRTWVGLQLASQIALLAAELGFEPALATTPPTAVCTKLPDCSHRCGRGFALLEGAAGWTRTSTSGVVADVVLAVEWTTPPGGMDGMNGMGGMNGATSASSVSGAADAAGATGTTATAATTGATSATTPPGRGARGPAGGPHGGPMGGPMGGAGGTPRKPTTGG